MIILPLSLIILKNIHLFIHLFLGEKKVVIFFLFRKNLIVHCLFLCMYVTVFAATQELSDSNTLVSENDSQQNKTMQLRQLALSNPEYVVCAGDVYNLSYNAGGQAISYTIQLDTSYRLKVANLATINVAGQRFTQVKKSVEDIVIKNYPFSAVQFTLVSPSQFKVLIKGEVSSVSEIITWGG